MENQEGVLGNNSGKSKAQKTRATESSAMAGDVGLDDKSSAEKSGTGKPEPILASSRGSAGNNSLTRESGNTTDLVKVQARLYECRALCFVGERLWKPGEKQYSALPLDALHWELVTEETEQRT